VSRQQVLAVGLLWALLAAACGHVGPLVPPEGPNGSDTAADGGA
jgi:predicted small lipoprotein YifL